MNENEFVEAVRLLLPGMYVLPHPSPRRRSAKNVYVQPNNILMGKY